MDLNALQQALRKFATDRSWGEFHTPKNLSMALMVEAAELAELFQWQTPEESISTRLNPQLQMRVGEELSDVLLYLLQLADHTGVDLELAVPDKLLKNAKKYPLAGEQATPQSDEQKQAQTHVLVDWENVHPKDSDIRNLVPDVTHVWIFHGPNQKRVDEDQKSFGSALTLVPISRVGKNSLDFHLSYYVGYISSRNPHARFVVLSNDQGYAPMLEHAKVLGFAASQIGFSKPPVVAVKPTTKKTLEKKAPAKKALPVKKSVKSVQRSVTPKPEKVNKPLAEKRAPKKAIGVRAKPVGRAMTVEKTAHVAATVKKKVANAPKTKRAGETPVVSMVAKEEPAAKKIAPVSNDEKVYSHVLASLRKSKNKPTRQARLYGAVRSLLGKESGSDAAAVERIVKRMTTEGHLTIDSNGAVVRTP